MELPVGVRRVGYRCAYRVLQVIWLVWRPRKQGVKCLLTEGDRILLVRHTYGRRSWDIPGGAMRRGEQPLATAQREMNEELGLSPQLEWVQIGQIQGTMDHRRDTIHCFRAELPSPTLTLDLGELAAARWFERDALPADLSPYVLPIVTNAPAPGGRPQA